ncbi:histidine--tRNA ligase [Candidatus Campbellbacteria bacterium]|nr:MAG: histidine--tRNA ligase [Candidatus Campbellbacteria bacterium]
MLVIQYDHMTEKSKKVSTEPYKGVRDFYPEDMAVQKYIFGVWRKVSEQFGYEEYAASILEPTELYASKTSDEIVNEQTYTFTDRGERSVTLRPEMTPSVARMVAARKRELAFPLRWYSIQNFFRYERPQRGRVREFWQLNADMFGVNSIDADVEIISLAYHIMKAFGANDEDFQIRINHRDLLQERILHMLRDQSSLPQAIRLIDKKQKMSSETFAEAWATLSNVPFVFETQKKAEVITRLESRGIRNVVLDELLARGFDYYTGMVFEVFDTNPENNRSIFGGGRYDRLLELFGDEVVPAVGFGLGDVTMRDFLETHKLLPAHISETDILICPVNEESVELASELADEFRKQGVSVAVYLGTKKIGDQISLANKKKIPFVVAVGLEEKERNEFTLKELKTGREELVQNRDIVGPLRRCGFKI